MRRGIRRSLARELALGLAALLAALAARAEAPPPELKIAFLGDQGSGSATAAVLQLILAEGADAVVHSGDFDYNDNPAAWDAQIDSVLGVSFPYFASVGNHDAAAYYQAGGYQERMEARMNRLGIPWSGDLGVQSTFTWRGIHFVMTGPDVFGPGDGFHDLYIRDQFASSNAVWRISSWHKNQHDMQAGGKSDEAGWGVYEQSRRAAAIMATGHEHSYSRTHLLSSMQGKTVASTAQPLVLEADNPATPEDEGRSFVFVSGLGGKSIRSQSVSGPWFASIYTSSQGANYGVLFGTFHVNGDPRLASFSFKDISGRVADSFTVRSEVGDAACGDDDGDGICNEADRCSSDAIASQLDSDRDGYGNACDADYDNDGVVGGGDFDLLVQAMGSTLGSPGYQPRLDADGNGIIAGKEFNLLRAEFGGPPGPSGLACAGSLPCTACVGADTDGDLVCDAEDDCVIAPNDAQLDTDLDGYGNACDADYDNDGVVGVGDLDLLVPAMGSSLGSPGYQPLLDSDGNGIIGGKEFNLVRAEFGGPPGPSGLACAGTPPCSAP